MTVYSYFFKYLFLKNQTNLETYMFTKAGFFLSHALENSCCLVELLASLHQT